MPGPIRYAKTEHNRRTAPQGEFCGGVGRPRFASHERYQHPLAAGREALAEIPHGEAVAGAEDAAAERTETRAPACDALFGRTTHRAGDQPVDGVLDALEDFVFLTPGHVRRRRYGRGRRL